MLTRIKSHHQQGFGILPIIAVIAVIAIIWLVGASAYRNFLDRQATSPQPTTSSSPSSPLAKGSTYVSMGDSYSSGWGADRTPDNPTIDTTVYDQSSKCLRNKNSAQYIVAKDLDYKLTDISCGGAVIDNILDKQQADNPPQLSKVTSDTALVTMTIGGNDTALLYALNCIQTSDCSGNLIVKTLVGVRISQLPANLEKLYKAIVAKAPHTKIRHAGYPYLIAAPGEPTGSCSSWLTADEQALFKTLLTDTNNKIKETIQKFAKQTGVDAAYVDPLAADSPFMQRDNGQMLDGCSTSNKRYMNGPNDKSEGGWHPNIYGQQHYATIYEKSLR